MKNNKKIIVVFYDGDVQMYDYALIDAWEFDPIVKYIRDAVTGKKLYDGERARCLGC